jgi:addiction module HigA family antidote
MNTTRCPTHPGEILREDALPALGLSVSTFARGLGVTRQAVHGVLSGRSAVSPEMAFAFGGFSGQRAATLAQYADPLRLVASRTAHGRAFAVTL